jgi:hypothetical protein
VSEHNTNTTAYANAMREREARLREQGEYNTRAADISHLRAAEYAKAVEAENAYRFAMQEAAEKRNATLQEKERYAMTMREAAEKRNAALQEQERYALSMQEAARKRNAALQEKERYALSMQEAARKRNETILARQQVPGGTVLRNAQTDPNFIPGFTSYVAPTGSGSGGSVAVPDPEPTASTDTKGSGAALVAGALLLLSLLN